MNIFNTYKNYKKIQTNKMKELAAQYITCQQNQFNKVLKTNLKIVCRIQCSDEVGEKTLIYQYNFLWSRFYITAK